MSQTNVTQEEVKAAEAVVTQPQEEAKTIDLPLPPALDVDKRGNAKDTNDFPLKAPAGMKALTAMQRKYVWQLINYARNFGAKQGAEMLHNEIQTDYFIVKRDGEEVAKFIKWALKQAEEENKKNKESKDEQSKSEVKETSGTDSQ